MKSTKTTPELSEATPHENLVTYSRAVKAVWGQLEDAASKNAPFEEIEKLLERLSLVDLDLFRFEVSKGKLDQEETTLDLVTEAERKAEDAAREAKELRDRLALSQQYGRGLNVSAPNHVALNG